MFYSECFAFSALTLLVGRQEGRGYLSGARCEWFAYGPTDATATPSSVSAVNSDWFTFQVPAYPGCPGKHAVKQMK